MEFSEVILSWYEEIKEHYPGEAAGIPMKYGFQRSSSSRHASNKDFLIMKNSLPPSQPFMILRMLRKIRY